MPHRRLKITMLLSVLVLCIAPYLFQVLTSDAFQLSPVPYVVIVDVEPSDPTHDQYWNTVDPSFAHSALLEYRHPGSTVGGERHVPFFFFARLGGTVISRPPPLA